MTPNTQYDATQPWPSLLWASLCALTLWGCAPIDMIPEPSKDDTNISLQSSKKSYIFNGEDWNYLPTFETNDTYRIGSHFGRAVARMDNCTSWLISDRFVVSAHHCRTSPDEIKAMRFGQYGLAHGSNAEGVRNARHRLIDLGFPAAQVNAMAVDDLQRFEGCRLQESEYGSSRRDIDYWQCNPKQHRVSLSVTYQSTSGATPQPGLDNTIVTVHPGHMYGHIDVRVGRRGEGRKLYGLSYNNLNNQAQANKAVLLSPSGFITDSDNDHRTSSGNYENGFEYIGTDMVCGSSGGVIMDRSQNIALGVMSATSGSNSCDRRSRGTGYFDRLRYYNIGAWFSARVRAYTDQPVRSHGLLDFYHFTSHHVGGRGGNASDLHCPANYLAAGVIYSENRDRQYIGNFGLICVPYWNNNRDLQLDKAVVVSGGSVDTRLGATTQDFNTYNRSVIDGDKKMQPFSMCLPGYYLKGVDVRTENGLVRSIRRLHCTKRMTSTNYATYTRFPRRSSPWLHLGSADSTHCPVGQAAAGLRINAGHLTDGFSLRCKRIRPRL
ncbi:MAG: hypothetical protein EP343_12525 [Deltaproteobacteria bacterium]|nr:MAG: hypothetical protein EP343_12525 [Deltaproteobacteria bacterium]